MKQVSKLPSFDIFLLVGIIFLILLSITTLQSIADFLFPVYFFYVVLAFLVYFVFSQIDFGVISLFSKHLYVLSIFFLILPLLIGQVTRGAIRWIPLGPLSIQPAEVVRPFLLVFFANFLASKSLNLKRFFQLSLLLLFPLLLILVQPSLGVTILTFVGFLGVLMASNIDKRVFLVGFVVFLLATPIIWRVIEPYQQSRILSFLDPSRDPQGTGYNSIQSMISVGSGKLSGRGLGKGVQTQLAFLPERHTDFIFASVAEEMGFIGATLVLSGLFIVLWRVAKIIEGARSPQARAFVFGIFLTLFAQTIVNIGMNVGLMPITGVPLPLVSAGGSSLVSTMMALGIAQGAKKIST